jgi:hypothetical protein
MEINKKNECKKEKEKRINYLIPEVRAALTNIRNYDHCREQELLRRKKWEDEHYDTLTSFETKDMVEILYEEVNLLRSYFSFFAEMFASFAEAQMLSLIENNEDCL